MNSITTFDKVQYHARLNDCEHVALAAPGTDTIGVLIRQEGDYKVSPFYYEYSVPNEKQKTKQKPRRCII